MKRKVSKVKTEESSCDVSSQTINKKEIIPIYVDGNIFEYIKTQVSVKQNLEALSAYYGCLLSLLEKLGGFKPYNDNEVVNKMCELLRSCEEFPQIFNNSQIISCLFKFFNIKLSFSQIETKILEYVKNILITLLDQKNNEAIKLKILEFPNWWILETENSEFVASIAGKFGTRFPNPEVCTLINQSKVSMAGFTSTYDIIFEKWLENLSLCSCTPDENIILQSDLYIHINQENSNIQIEDYALNEIFMIILCCGSYNIRACAAKKITTWLNNARIVKIVMQFIATLIYNMHLNSIPEDSTCLAFLLKLKIKFLISTALRHPDYFHFYVPYFSELFDTYCDYTNATISNFIDRFSESFGYFMIECYLDSAQYKRSLPSYNSIWDSKKHYTIDEKVLKVVYDVQMIYISWFVHCVSSISHTKNKIVNIFFTGLKTILFFRPLSHYIPPPELPTVNFSDYNFIKNQLMYLIFVDNHNIILNLVGLLLPYSNLLFTHTPIILDFFSAIFDFLLDVNAELKTEILHLINVFIQNKFIENIFDFMSLSVPGSDLRLFNACAFYEIQKICIKFFVLSPHIIGPIIFGRFTTTKYIMLTLIFPEMDIKCFSGFENAQVIDSDIQNNIIATKFPLLASSEYLVINVYKNLPTISLELLKDIQDVTRHYSLSAIVLENSIIFKNFIERLWKYSLDKKFNEPQDLFSCFVFVPNLIQRYENKYWANLCPLVLLIYLYMDYLTIFFPSNQIIINKILQSLRTHDLDQEILPLLTSCFDYEFVSYPALILFFALTSKDSTEFDSPYDSNYLNDYFFEIKYNYLLNKITDITTRALYFEFMTQRFEIYFKILNILPSNNNFQLLRWIIKNAQIANNVFHKYSNCYTIVLNTILKNWVDCLDVNDVYACYLLLAMSIDIVNDGSVDPYILMRQKVELMSEHFRFSPDLIKHNTSYKYIFSTKDENLIELFMNRFAFNGEAITDLSSLFEFLQVGSYSSATIKIIVPRILSLFQSNLKITDFSETWIKTTRRVILSSHSKENHSILEALLNTLGMKWPVLSFPISTPSLGPPQNTSISEESNISSTCPTEADMSKEIPPFFYNEQEFELFLESVHDKKYSKNFDLTDMNNINSRLQKCSDICNLIQSHSRDILQIIQSMPHNSLTELISVTDLFNLMVVISQFEVTTFQSYPSKILELISCLYKHPQIYHGEREANESYYRIKNNIPNNSKFNNMLLSCLLYEAVSEGPQNMFEKLSIRFQLWKHIHKSLKLNDIQNIVPSIIDMSKKFQDLLYSEKVVLIFLHLNNSSLFYEYIYDNLDSDNINTIARKIKCTLNDQFSMRILKNCAECFRKNIPDNRSIYLLLVLCKILRLFPLLVIRHLSYFLSTLNLNLKTFSSSTVSEKSEVFFSKYYCLSILVDVIKILEDFKSLDPIDLVLLEKINNYIKSIISKGPPKYDVIMDLSKVDLVISSLKNLINKPSINNDPYKLTFFDVAHWFLNVPIQHIPQLKNYINHLASCLLKIYKRTNRKQFFIETYLPLILYNLVLSPFDRTHYNCIYFK
ncbi:hypothetical protein HZS_3828 [Henneguya salminicola]|nr:hypothetical protein HZS_3828 [Henneguya salminicola]